MLSSTTIDYQRNPSRGGLLISTVVNSESQRAAFCTNPRGKWAVGSVQSSMRVRSWASLFGQNRRKFPAYSALNLQSSSTVNRDLCHAFRRWLMTAQHSGQVLMFEGKTCSVCLRVIYQMEDNGSFIFKAGYFQSKCPLRDVKYF